MRKAIAFILGVGLLAAVLAGTGCKPRDIRNLVTPYVPSAPAGTDCATSGTYTFDGYLDFYVSEPTGSTRFQDCGAPYVPPQRVYEIVVEEGGWLEIDAYDFDCPVYLSFRSSCDPNDTSDVLCPYDSGCDEGCWAELPDEYYEAGTYYLVVYTMDGGCDGWIEIEWD